MLVEVRAVGVVRRVNWGDQGALRTRGLAGDAVIHDGLEIVVEEICGRRGELVVEITQKDRAGSRYMKKK